MLRKSRLGRSGRRFLVTATLFATIAVVTAAPSPAKSPLSTTIVVSQAVKRTCFARNFGTAPGVVSRSVTAPGFGLIRVRLTASFGDWDLGVFDARTGKTVAASAHFRARELADGLVQKGQRLVVQACRIAGEAKRARLTVGFEPLKRPAHPAQLVRVSTPTREAKSKLQSLGLDVTEHGGKDFLSVVVYNPRQAAKLGQAGFISVTEIADLDAQSRRDRRSEADWARGTAAPADTQTFTNMTPITIFDGGGVLPASPYPSTIPVSGLPTTTTDVNVTLTGVTHDFGDDIDVLLVGPAGQKVVLMSDAGDGIQVAAADVTLDDAAAVPLPDEDEITTGTYTPSNYFSATAGCPNEEFDPFPAPAPAPAYGSMLADFTGTNPNGTWSLYVLDDCQLFAPAGAIAGGWSIQITTPPPTPPTVGLPSGRTGPYRTLAEYTSEMNALATNNPSIVKKFTLPNLTWEGRPVEGIEISTNVNARDGKPVFLNMGLHHAREWPSGEHSIEWAYELINGYNANPSSRAGNLVQNARTLIIPVVNVDGFNMSRTVGQALHANGVGGNENNNVLTNPNEFRRKNCRIHPPDPPPPPSTPTCAQPALGLVSTGVDPNRNYGTFWGGPGSSTDPLNETFHGPHCPNETMPAGAVKAAGCGPFSEPETENIRFLVSRRHVTTLITNHTFTGLVLRAPGLASQGLAFDELAMKALGDAMADENGYVSQYGWQLYDTTGTTEDWTYNTTGGYGYTFEIGPSNFHPPYNLMIQEYDGTATWQCTPAFPCPPFNAADDGNREAYFIAMENTVNPVHHSVITGNAPLNAFLRLKKTFQTPTSIRDTNNVTKTFTDTLDTVLDVPGAGSGSGPYTWHINPSTRPLVAKDRGGTVTGVPSPPVTFSGTVAGPPPDGAAPCADFDTTDPGCWNDHGFTVPGGPGIQNDTAVVRIEWISPGSDWDMKVFRDTNGDGSSVGETQLVGSSGAGTTGFEQTSIGQPTLTAGQYVVRVINWAAAEPYNGNVRFYSPEPFQPATTETWTLTCELPEGNALTTQEVLINRGQQKTINFTSTCGQGPTGVELASFAARRAKGGVTVTWRTANERNIAGFNVWRAGKKLNRALIAAKRSGTVAGASYQLVDRSARAGVRYTYRLQAVTRDGSRSWLRQSTVRAKR